MSDIKLARLFTGEMVVGKVSRDGLESCYLVQAVPQEGPNGSTSFNVMVLPMFIPISKEGVNIANVSIVTSINAPDNLAQEYTRATSGLYIPNPGESSQILSHNPVMK